MSFTNINDEIPDMEELINLKEEWHDMISTFTEDRELPQLIQTVKKALKILPIYEEVMEVEEEVLKIIWPLVKEAIFSICEENENIVKSLDHSQLKTNLLLTIDLLDTLNKILDYLMNFKQVEGCHLQSVPINAGQIIYRIFKYCNSCKLADTVLEETLQLFRKTQEVHAKYLAWLDNCMAFNLMEQVDVNILKEVLDILCYISQVLSGVNWKSGSENWKGYISLAQKYCELLGVQFNSSLPIKCIAEEIHLRLSLVVEIGVSNQKMAVQNAKLAGFMIKVATRLLESYWIFIENCLCEIMDLLVVIYSYPCGYFEHFDFPKEFLDTVKTVVFKTVEPFIIKFVNEPSFLKFIINSNKIPGNKLGFISLTNSILNFFPENINEALMKELKIKVYLQSIFDCVKNCYHEFFLFDHIFYEEFISNIATTALRCPEYYSDVEQILMGGVLQDRIWLALLSIDVWCLILRNCPIITVIETLHGLVAIIETLDFGLFSPRPEEIFLKTLMHRILSFIPSNYKNELFNKYNTESGPCIGKFLKLDVSVNPKCLVEDTVSKFLSKSEGFGPRSDLQHVLFLAENLEVISCINFQGFNYRNTKLVEMICRFWNYKFNERLLTNNFFKYFMSKLCKATSAIMEDLNDAQYLTILNQMNKLTSNPFFELLLLAFIQQCYRKSPEINSAIANLLQTISSDKNPIVKNLATEIADKAFKGKPKKESGDHNNGVDSDDDEVKVEFLKSLGNCSFTHKCIEWSRSRNLDGKASESYCGKKVLKEAVQKDTLGGQRFKKIKIDNEQSIIEPDSKQKIKNNIEFPVSETKKVKTFEENKKKITLTEDDEDEVADIIKGLKCEIKKMAKILSKKSLNSRQIKDILGVIRNLESFLN